MGCELSIDMVDRLGLLLKPSRKMTCNSIVINHKV